MKRVIFLTYHGRGHFNACFKLAKLLHPEYTVTFAGVEFFKRHVESQGFHYYTLATVPFGLGFEKWVNITARKKFVYFHALRDRWKNTLFKRRQAELKKMILDLTPYTILIDSLQSTDFITLFTLLKNSPIRVALFQTMPPMALLPGKPPINSFAFPDDQKAVKKATRSFFRKRWIKTLSKKISYLGMDDFTIIKKTIEQSSFPKKYLSPLHTPFGLVYNELPEFILMPREFDFPAIDPPPTQHYLGWMIDTDRIETCDTGYPEIKERLTAARNNGAKIIYCSFSSVPHDDTGIVKSFLDRLILAVTNTNRVLLVSIPSGFKEIRPAENIPDNVYFLNVAPQLEVLTYSDLLITHGGFNSIKEAIHAGVPMLIYPAHTYFDVPGITTRVVYHQLGLQGNLRRDTVQIIDQKITELLTNNLYQEKISRMAAVNEMYTGEKFRILFEESVRALIR